MPTQNCVDTHPTSKNCHQPGPLGRVGHRVVISVCVFVTKVLIINYGSCFSHKTEQVNMVLRIIKLEGHQNCMIGSKVTTILTMFFVCDLLGFCTWNQSTVDNGGVSSGRSLAVGVSDRWKVTCDM